MQNCIIHGDIFYTPEKDRSVSAPDSCLVIENGKIKGCFREIPEEFRSFRLLDYSGRLVIPALYDLHVHASQYQFRGLWMDEELLSWLNEHTLFHLCGGPLPQRHSKSMHIRNNPQGLKHPAVQHA